MSTITLTVYTLIWPAIVLVVMGIIGRAFISEWLAAKREGKDLI